MKLVIVLLMLFVVIGCSNEDATLIETARIDNIVEEHILDAFLELDYEREYGNLDVLSEEIKSIEWLVFELEVVDNVGQRGFQQIITYLITQQKADSEIHETVMLEKFWAEEQVGDGDPYLSVITPNGVLGFAYGKSNLDTIAEFFDVILEDIRDKEAQVDGFSVRHNMVRGYIDLDDILKWQATYELNYGNDRVIPQRSVETIVLSHGNWNSSRFHTQIAKVIIEHGYDINVEVESDTTLNMRVKFGLGEIHANLEVWSRNIPAYETDLVDGYYEAVSINFDDAFQGLYIPQYLADQHPGLKTIQDLPDFKHLFPDPEIVDWNPEIHKAVVYGGIPNWTSTVFLKEKFNNDMLYPGLVEHFAFRPVGSTALLNGTLLAAYENNAPWVGYHWEPNEIMGKLDMVLLEDKVDFDQDSGAGNHPPGKATVIVTTFLQDDFPELYDFFCNYRTSSAITSAALYHMEEAGITVEQTAIWWLLNNTDIWRDWVPEEVFDKVMSSVESH